MRAASEKVHDHLYVTVLVPHLDTVLEVDLPPLGNTGDDHLLRFFLLACTNALSTSGRTRPSGSSTSMSSRRSK
jgi:hypothetical protein